MPTLGNLGLASSERIFFDHRLTNIKEVITLTSASFRFQCNHLDDRLALRNILTSGIFLKAKGGRSEIHSCKHL